MTAASRSAVLATVAGLAAGWLAAMLLVWLYGESPRAIALQLVTGTWAVPYGVGQVLYKATALLLTGVAVDLALRAGLFNIGAEGQLAVAGLAVAGTAAGLPATTPAWIALPTALATAALAGAAWAVVPMVLRVRYHGHEVISTIMMNRVADALVAFCLARGMALPGTVRTADAIPATHLPRLDAVGLRALHGSSVSAALPLAVGVTACVAVWLRRSRIGREVVLVGMSPRACEAAHIPVGRRLGVALLVSGAIAGLAAAGPVLGNKGYFESGLGAGAGFGGIAVALIGRGHPVGLGLAALLFGTLDQGGLAINGRVPMEVVTVVQGVVIAAVALADARIRAVALRGVTS